jgi:uncharacterized protein DUF5615
MGILLDECVPRKFSALLIGHDCQTAISAGFAGNKNGALLQLAEKAGFDVLLTLDRGIACQQNLAGRRISVVALGTKSSRLRDISPLAQACLKLLAGINEGGFYLIDR